MTAEIEAIENGLQPALQIKGDSIRTFNILDRMERYNIPGASIAIVENGSIKWTRGYGVANTETGQPVDENTLFQAGSISKPVAALAALKLVEEGQIDPDRDINAYLTDWKIEENPFTETEKVTLDRLLSHTAGMTVHGFPGYRQNDTFPSITAVLSGEGNTAAVYPDTIPGSIWRYSGGGYTVMEKTVEDVSGMPLEEYMEEHILQPIGMDNSTYMQPLNPERHSQASAAYNREGEILEGLWHNYPEQAAAGLWTTPSDLAKYVLEIQEILDGKEDGILSRTTVERMLTKQENGWGLGPSLQWEGDSLLFRHGGKNAGFTNELVAFARQGKAVIIMTNADNGGNLIGELLRSVSAHYGWGISEPRMIESVEISPEQLKRLTGRYVFTTQSGDEYEMNIDMEDNRLVAENPLNSRTGILIPVGQMQFVDPDTGEGTEFRIDEDTGAYSLVWRGNIPFTRVEE